MTPSLTPSIMSHASIAAARITGYFAGGITLASSLWRAFQTRSDCAARPVQSIAGEPAMMPLKSSGYRCAATNPSLPPAEQPFQYQSFGPSP